MTSILSEQWEILVIIPFVVSVIANLLTPLIRRTIISVIAAAAHNANKGLNGIVLLRVRQIDNEIHEITQLTSSQEALIKHYRHTVFFIGTGLWVIFLSPIIAMFVQMAAINYGHHLPGELGMALSVPGFAFAITIGSLFAAGPFQAAIYSSYVGRRLKSLEENPSAVIEKLVKEREYLSTGIARK